MSPIIWAVVAVLGAFVLFWAYFRIRFAFWKRDFSKGIRKESIAQSQATITGKVTEHLSPYLPGFRFNPRDVRFLGSPVDLIVFDGLQEGSLRRLVLVEVKSGKASSLTERERMIRDAILSGPLRVEWDVLHIP